MSQKALKELMVLSTIRAHPAHGYALTAMLTHGVGWTLGLTKPTIYAILKRFEKHAWVQFETAKDSNFPERQIYHLTEQGEQAYFDLLRSCAKDKQLPVLPLVGLLAHLDDLPQAEQTDTLQHLLSVRQTQLEQLQEFPAHEGNAGAAITLTLEQLALEIKTLKRLLGDEIADAPSASEHQ